MADKREQILSAAAAYGEVGQFGTNRSFDDDGIFDAIEKDLDVDLGVDTTSPLCRAITKAYRDAYREANI